MTQPLSQPGLAVWKTSKLTTVAALRHGGTHLIRTLVAGLGFVIVEPGKDGVPLNREIGRPIVFLRDPRDRMVATWKWRTALYPDDWKEERLRGKPMKPKHHAIMMAIGDRDAGIAYLLGPGGGFMVEMLTWARIWCEPGRRDWLTLRYEDFAKNGADQVARITQHLGFMPNRVRDEALFQSHWGHARTVTAIRSDWQRDFGPASLTAFRRLGGSELLDLMGYE